MCSRPFGSRDNESIDINDNKLPTDLESFKSLEAIAPRDYITNFNKNVSAGQTYSLILIEKNLTFPAYSNIFELEHKRKAKRT